MSDDKTIFNELSSVDISNKVRAKKTGGKNGKPARELWYLSWATALREVLKRYPGAEWHYREWDGLPWLQTKAGVFVECTVIIGDTKRTQLLPVLDMYNRPVLEPDSAQINKAMQRALAKCIALHGLGLELWAGEDLDAEQEVNEDKPAPPKPKISDDGFEAALQKIKAGDLTVDRLRDSRELTQEQIDQLDNLA